MQQQASDATKVGDQSGRPVRNSTVPRADRNPARGQQTGAGRVRTGGPGARAIRPGFGMLWDAIMMSIELERQKKECASCAD
jgi:hypothetical protein